MNPYREAQHSIEPNKKGGYIYGELNKCPYCGNKVCNDDIKWGFTFDNYSYFYSYQFWAITCNPRWRFKAHWYNRECKEPGHHIHVTCGKCRTSWLVEIIPNRVSEI